MEVGAAPSTASRANSLKAVGRKPSGERLLDALPDGLRCSAFMDAVTKPSTAWRTNSLKAVGREPSGERLLNALPDG